MLSSRRRRILSRDETCDVVEAFQGRAEAARLRRCLRSNDYPSAATIVLEGYVAQLRRRAHASCLALSLLRDYLKKHVVLDAAQAAATLREHEGGAPHLGGGLAASAARQPQQPQPQEQRRPLTSGRARAKAAPRRRT